MNKKGKMEWEYVIKIIIAFAIVLLVAVAIYTYFIGGKEGGEEKGGLLNIFLKQLGTEQKTISEVKAEIEEYKSQESWEDVIEKLIYYKEQLPGERETITYLENESFRAYKILYTYYVVQIKNPTSKITPLDQYPFCPDALRYYEKMDSIFDDFSELGKDADEVELVIKVVAQFCYNIYGDEYFYFPYLHRSLLKLSKEEQDIDFGDALEKLDKCFGDSCKIAKSYYKRSTSIDISDEYTAYAEVKIKEVEEKEKKR